MLALLEIQGVGDLRVVGALEGACDSLAGNRLKFGGMHRTVAGADAIIALRCCLESNRFDDFLERHAG